MLGFNYVPLIKLKFSTRALKSLKVKFCKLQNLSDPQISLNWPIYYQQIPEKSAHNKEIKSIESKEIIMSLRNPQAEKWPKNIVSLNLIKSKNEKKNAGKLAKNFVCVLFLFSQILFFLFLCIIKLDFWNNKFRSGGLLMNLLAQVFLFLFLLSYLQKHFSYFCTLQIETILFYCPFLLLTLFFFCLQKWSIYCIQTYFMSMYTQALPFDLNLINRIMAVKTIFYVFSWRFLFKVFKIYWCEYFFLWGNLWLRLAFIWGIMVKELCKFCGYCLWISGDLSVNYL